MDNYNIYLSVNNLEKDLVASKLRASLSEYYGESDDCKLVAIMQKRKAENMLSYLEDYEDALKVLEDDDIVIPLKRIVSLVEKDGHPNE